MVQSAISDTKNHNCGSFAIFCDILSNILLCNSKLRIRKTTIVEFFEDLMCKSNPIEISAKYKTYSFDLDCVKNLKLSARNQVLFFISVIYEFNNTYIFKINNIFPISLQFSLLLSYNWSKNWLMWKAWDWIWPPTLYSTVIINNNS